jgi:DNA repair protein RecO (recombination protein O)
LPDSWAATARWWLRAMVGYEALLLAELGFGLDLELC